MKLSASAALPPWLPLTDGWSPGGERPAVGRCSRSSSSPVSARSACRLGLLRAWRRCPVAAPHSGWPYLTPAESRRCDDHGSARCHGQIAAEGVGSRGHLGALLEVMIGYLVLFPGCGRPWSSSPEPPYPSRLPRRLCFRRCLSRPCEEASSASPSPALHNLSASSWPDTSPTNSASMCSWQTPPVACSPASSSVEAAAAAADNWQGPEELTVSSTIPYLVCRSGPATSNGGRAAGGPPSDDAPSLPRPIEQHCPISVSAAREKAR